MLICVCFCVRDWQVYALDIVMAIINSHWSPQVTELYEELMEKWQTGRQLDKAILETTKALSLGNPECFRPEAPFPLRYKES